MDCYDVVIVGGGPAGSSCAWALRHSALKIAIFDRAQFPRDKICGGWITPDVLTEVEIDPSDYARDHILQPIQGFLVGSIGHSAVEVNYGRPVSYGIRRREFDDYLLRRSGAKLLLGQALKTIERTTDGWIVNGEIKACFLVGAGGHFCPVARFVQAKSDEAPVVAQEVEFEMNAQQREACRVREDTPELYFCGDMKGYGWCFRKGDILNVGLGRADPHGLPAHSAGFLKFLKSSCRIGFDVPPLHGHAYLLKGTSTRRMAGEDYVLIGDAAGLASFQSGEGILPAVQSGLQAAKSILGRDVNAYVQSVARPPHSIAAKLGQSLPSSILSSFARNLLKTRWFVRNVVLDDWFLHN